MRKPIYKVTVRVIREEESLTRKSWTEGGSENQNSDETYGYTPQVIQIEEVDRILYEQSITELDIAAVIKAVNTPNPPLVFTPPPLKTKETLEEYIDRGGKGEE